MAFFIDKRCSEFNNLCDVLFIIILMFMWWLSVNCRNIVRCGCVESVF